MESEHDEPPTTGILAVSESGISIAIDGRPCRLSWDAVSSISGTVSKGDDDAVIISIGIDSVDGERALLVTDHDPVWRDLLKLLHVGLPIAPLAAWATGIAAFPGAYVLYKRQPLGIQSA